MLIVSNSISEGDIECKRSVHVVPSRSACVQRNTWSNDDLDDCCDDDRVAASDSRYFFLFHCFFISNLVSSKLSLIN